MPKPRILVIKLSALGDFVAAMGHFRSIRDFHAHGHITLLTTPPFERLARDGGWFDAVWTDGRPLTTLGYWRLVARLRASRFHRVYDLQGVSRTSLLFQWLRPFPPEWVGTAWGASHRIPKSKLRQLTGHASRRALLDLAGLPPGPETDLNWADTIPKHIDVAKPYAVLVPGAAPSRPRKRWPVEGYIEIARRLRQANIWPVVIGHRAEREAGEAIAAAVPGAANLVEQTDLSYLVHLGREAALVIGNDTGPMHLMAAAGAPCLVLFSSDSDPDRHKPIGPHVHVLQREPLSSLTANEVWTKAQSVLPPP